MRSNLDGSQIETLVEAGRGEADRRDQTRWCVGIAIDPEAWEDLLDAKRPDKAGSGRIFRAGIEIPKGETAANRPTSKCSSISLPEPIDLELDLEKSRSLLDRSRRSSARQHSQPGLRSTQSRRAPEIVLTHLMEGIGIALDVPGDRMFVTDFAGSVYSAEARRIETNAISSPPRAISPASPTPKSETHQKEN